MDSFEREAADIDAKDGAKKVAAKQETVNLEAIKKEEEDDDDEDMQLESKISKTLSERTTKIVIILVLVMLFLTPLFQSDTYDSVDRTTHQQGLHMLKEIYKTGPWSAYQRYWKGYVETHRKLGYNLIYLEGPDPSSKTKTTKIGNWTDTDRPLAIYRTDATSTLFSDMHNITFVCIYD